MQRDDLVLMLELQAESLVLFYKRSNPLLVHGVQDAQIVHLDFQPLVLGVQSSHANVTDNGAGIGQNIVERAVQNDNAAVYGIYIWIGCFARENAHNVTPFGIVMLVRLLQL